MLVGDDELRWMALLLKVGIRLIALWMMLEIVRVLRLLRLKGEILIRLLDEMGRDGRSGGKSIGAGNLLGRCRDESEEVVVARRGLGVLLLLTLLLRWVILVVAIWRRRIVVRIRHC